MKKELTNIEKRNPETLVATTQTPDEKLIMMIFSVPPL